MEESNLPAAGRRFGAGKLAIWILVVLSVCAISIVSILRERIVNVQQNQVTITGQGKVTYKPDIANITFGVQIDKVAKADEALNQLSAKINNVIAAIRAQGVAPEDILTQNYTLSPQYDYSNNVQSLSGYNANEQITVKVRDIVNNPNKVSQILSEASKAGINQVGGVSFDVSDLEALKQQARLLAIADANSKSAKMADAAGVKLGEVVGWWENLVQAPGTGTGISYADGKGGAGGSGAMSASPAVPSGSQEIILEMNLSYKIK